MLAYMRVLTTLLDAIVREVNSDKDHAETFRVEVWEEPPERIVETEYVRRVRRLIREGRSVLLVGEPGAGKSTTAVAACERPYPVVLTFGGNIPLSVFKTLVNTLRRVGPIRLLRSDAILIGDALIEGPLTRLPGLDEACTLLALGLLLAASRLLRKPVVAMLASDKSYYRPARELMERAGFEVVEIEHTRKSVERILRAHGVRGRPSTRNPRRELTRLARRPTDRSSER